MRNTALKKSLCLLGRQNKANENKLIIIALLGTRHPLTRRELSERTGIEISCLCRALFNMVYKRKTVFIAKYGKCKSTKKTVMHFSLFKGGKHGK